MYASRRPFPPRSPLASLSLVCACLLGSLISSCDFGADGERPTVPVQGNPADGKNPPAGDTAHAGPGDTAHAGPRDTIHAGHVYYTFEFPAASSRLNLDSTYTIRWRASDSTAQGSVRVFLYRNDTLLGPLMESFRASGSFDWKFAGTQNVIGKIVGPGSGYSLRVVNEGDSTKSDFGPLFSLYSDPGSLILTAPAAGAQVKADSGIRIAWTSSGKVGDEVGFALYRDTTLVWDMGTTAPTAAGEYLWSLVPEWLPSGDGYRFRIFSTSEASLGQMGPAFTLILPALYGTYEFVRPRSGDVWVAGGTGDLEWNVTGNPGGSSGLTLWRDSPREVVWGWTPGDTHDYAGQWSVPANLASGTYRFRIGSLADTTLFAFSPAFTIHAAGSGGIGETLRADK